MMMRILCADDDPIMLDLLEATLTEWGYAVTTAPDGNRAWQALSDPDSPRLAVLDWMMPGLNGPEVIQRVRAEKREHYVYMLLLSGKSNKADLVQGMMSGADDYVTKPFDPHELKMRIRAGQRILDLQSQLLLAQAKLQRQASHDVLTGIYNRRAIIDQLGFELNRGRRVREPVAVVIVDLDNFKRVNDAHGHQVGDEVLREATGRMSAVLRDYDAIGRYGGEEFLIVLSRCPPEVALAVAERLREILEMAPVECRHGSLRVQVRASFGVASALGDTAMDPETLIGAADAALYRAKDRGRNRVEVASGADFDPSLKLV